MSDGRGFPNRPAQPTAPGEPSMEEILASIRKILTEEENERATRPPEPDDDVLILDPRMKAGGNESVAAPPPQAAQAVPQPQWAVPQPPVQPQQAAARVETTYIPASALPPGPATPYSPPSQALQKESFMDDQLQVPAGLVSDKAVNEIANSVGSLVRSVSSERSVQVGRAGVTIEDLVREEIKPVLKAWLDSHLPSLVERVVRTEIGRVIDRMQS